MLAAGTHWCRYIRTLNTHLHVARRTSLLSASQTMAHKAHVEWENRAKVVDSVHRVKEKKISFVVSHRCRWHRHRQNLSRSRPFVRFSFATYAHTRFITFAKAYRFVHVRRSCELGSSFASTSWLRSKRAYAPFGASAKHMQKFTFMRLPDFIIPKKTLLCSVSRFGALTVG